MDSTRECSEELRESLVAYLYGECDETEREQVERHVATCSTCASELESLRSVRGALGQWETPEPALGFRLVADRERGVPWWRQALEPTWGLAAAAGLILVVAAAASNVRVDYDASGFTVRMGWAGAPAAVPDPGESVAASPLPPSDPAPWRAELVRLEDRLRRDMITETVAPPVAAAETDHGELLRELERLIAQSELRQQQEVAVWFTAFAQEFDMQRRADQQRFHQDLGALEGVTDYLVRVSQR